MNDQVLDFHDERRRIYAALPARRLRLLAACLSERAWWYYAEEEDLRALGGESLDLLWGALEGRSTDAAHRDALVGRIEEALGTPDEETGEVDEEEIEGDLAQVFGTLLHALDTITDDEADDTGALQEALLYVSEAPFAAAHHADDPDEASAIEIAWQRSLMDSLDASPADRVERAQLATTLAEAPSWVESSLRSWSTPRVTG